MHSSIPINIVPIENDGFHLMIDVKIGRKKAIMLIDTGASRSVFDQKRIQRFVSDDTDYEINEKLSTGLGTNSMESKATILKKLKIGDIVIHDYLAIVLDMDHVNQSYNTLGLKGIDGVLGSDILNEYEAVIDYGSKSLILRKS